MYRSTFLDLGTSWRLVVSFKHRPLYFRENASGTHWIGGWVDPRDSLDDVEKIKFLKLPILELRPLGHPAPSQSLYRLRYPGSSRLFRWKNNTKTDTNEKWCEDMIGIPGSGQARIRSCEHTFWFHKRWGISWLSERQLHFEEWLCR
jgi:hypothetical protein